MKSIIKIEEGIKFLGDAHEIKVKYNNDLPHNCIFNKVSTGCGGTTVALTNDVNYIIAVPTTELIMNKLHTSKAGLSTEEAKLPHPTYGLFGDGSKKEYDWEDVHQYLLSNKVKKMMISYEKTASLYKKMKEWGINPKDYCLLVDEMHRLTKDYSYRDNGIDSVLDTFKEFGSHCFMSATPLVPDCIPELADLDIIECEWPNISRIKVNSTPTNKPYSMVAKLINIMKDKGYLQVEGKRTEHLFIFINSVTDIKAVIDHCNLTNDDCRIICSDKEKNRKKVGNIAISTSNYNPDKKDEANKMFTFLTSKAYEGADFWCTDGLIILVSNTGNTNTCFDVATDMQQIAGRIRNMESFNFIYHIYNTTKADIFSEFSVDDIEGSVKKQIGRGKDLEKFVLDHYVYSNSEDRQLVKKDYPSIEEHYGTWRFNERALYVRLYNFKVAIATYRDGAAYTSTLQQNGMLGKQGSYQKLVDKLARPTWATFKNVFKEYAEKMTTNQCFAGSQEAMELEANYPITDKDLLALYPKKDQGKLSLLKLAYEKLGEDKVRAARYSQKTITDMLINLEDTENKELNAAAAILKEFSIGTYTKKVIKSKLQTIYDSFELDKKAKASDIEDYFDCKATTSNIQGKIQSVYVLLSSKAILKPSKQKEVIVDEISQTKLDWDAVIYNEAIQEVEYNEQEKYVADYISQATGCDLQDILSWAALCGFDVEMVTRVYNNIKK